MSTPLETGTFSAEFEAFAGLGSAAAIHQQDAFNDFLGREERHFDLNARTLAGGGITLGGVTSLGSFSHLSQTWLWAWDNPNLGWDHPAVAPTRAVHDFGKRRGIPELTTGHLDFSAFPDPQQAATTMAIAAGTVLGGHGVWSCRINEGKGSAYVHVDDPQLPVAGFDRFATPRLLTTAAQVFPAHPRRVAQGYFERFRVPYKETDRTIVGTTSDGVVIEVSFDREGRLDRVSTELEPSDA